MARCEDYPCCGHEPGDCPTIDSDGNERWTCVGCGKLLPVNAPSSICDRCMSKRVWDRDSLNDVEYGEDNDDEVVDAEFYIDHDHSMDY